MKIKIKLVTPIDINGVKTDTIVLREPTVGDSLDVQKLAPNDDDQREVLMLARLADISPEDLKRMGMKDFRRMQKGYLRLVAVGEGAPVVRVDVDLAGDVATRAALGEVLDKLFLEDVDDLKRRGRLDASRLRHLVLDDHVRTLLEWMDDPDATRASLTSVRKRGPSQSYSASVLIDQTTVCGSAHCATVKSINCQICARSPLRRICFCSRKMRKFSVRPSCIHSADALPANRSAESAKRIGRTGLRMILFMIGAYGCVSKDIRKPHMVTPGPAFGQRMRAAYVPAFDFSDFFG